MDKDPAQTNPTEMIITPPVKSKNIPNGALNRSKTWSFGQIQSIQIPQASGHFQCDLVEATA